MLFLVILVVMNELKSYKERTIFYCKQLSTVYWSIWIDLMQWPERFWWVVLHAGKKKASNSSSKIFMLKMDPKSWAQLKSSSPRVLGFEMRALLTASPLCRSVGRDESREHWDDGNEDWNVLYKFVRVYFYVLKRVEIKEHELSNWENQWCIH